MFCIYDYKKTDFYHGINRNDDYYTTEKNLKLPLHQRKRKWPTIQEFWESTEPQAFQLAADDQADWRKFRRWLAMQLRKMEPEDKSFYEINNPKFEKEVNMHHGDWNQEATFCHDVLAHNYDFTFHMTPEELKAYKGPVPEKVEIPFQFDLEKAKRVIIDKDAVKLEQMERESAKLKE